MGLTDEFVNERVAKGAEWLDANYGTAWAHDIDVDALNMADPATCVLGQLYADKAAAALKRSQYTGYLYALALVGEDTEVFDCGFALNSRDINLFFSDDPARYADERKDAWRKLRDTWVMEIHQRTAAQ